MEYKRIIFGLWLSGRVGKQNKAFVYTLFYHPSILRAYPNNGSLSLVMLSSGLLTENAVKHLGYERRYQTQILRLRLRMTNAKG